MTTPAIDPEYDRLLREVHPRPPHNKAENERLLGEIEKLMLKGERSLSPAENDLLITLFALVQEYEQAKYPRKKASPAELLEFLMEENSLSAKDLPLPASRVSEILSGTREISKAQAKKLGEFFHVSPAAFI